MIFIMGKLSEAKKEANKRYIAKTYDKITFTVKKGKKDCIKDVILHTGESLNAFINRAIDECIEKWEKEHR